MPVYIMTCGDQLKVGKSNNPRSRWKGIRCSNPQPVELVYEVSTPNDFAVEREAHRILDEYRQGGEWFRTTTEVAIRAIEEARTNLGSLAPEAVQPRPVTTQPPDPYAHTIRMSHEEWAELEEYARSAGVEATAFAVWIVQGWLNDELVPAMQHEPEPKGYARTLADDVRDQFTPREIDDEAPV